MRIIKMLIFVLLAELSFISSSFAASFDECKGHFLNGAPPKLKRNDAQTRELCFNGFAVLYNSNGKVAMYSAEKLNRKELIDGYDVGRSNEFYEESRLRSSERALLSDYRRSGYDRGHLSPSADMSDENAMVQSFSLANIVPQDPVMNRHAWASVEKATRKYIKRADGNIYVVTGTLFNEKVDEIGRGVWVPSKLWKAVYDPLKDKGWVYVMDNNSKADISKPISLEDFYRLYGIDVFPAIGLF